MSHEREFKILFEESGLTQSRLAGLLGLSRVTVNRWFVDRDDRIAVPPYALQYLRLYMMLPQQARDRVPLYNARKPAESDAAQ